jgi:phage gp36-like protein
LKSTSLPLDELPAVLRCVVDACCVAASYLEAERAAGLLKDGFDFDARGFTSS